MGLCDFAKEIRSINNRYLLLTRSMEISQDF
jgi:hypothetical protein